MMTYSFSHGVEKHVDIYFRLCFFWETKLLGYDFRGYLLSAHTAGLCAQPALLADPLLSGLVNGGCEENDGKGFMVRAHRAYIWRYL